MKVPTIFHEATRDWIACIPYLHHLLSLGDISAALEVCSEHIDKDGEVFGRMAKIETLLEKGLEGGQKQRVLDIILDVLVKEPNFSLYQQAKDLAVELHGRKFKNFYFIYLFFSSSHLLNFL